MWGKREGVWEKCSFCWEKVKNDGKKEYIVSGEGRKGRREAEREREAGRLGQSGTLVVVCLVPEPTRLPGEWQAQVLDWQGDDPPGR